MTTTPAPGADLATERALFEAAMNAARFFPAELNFARTKSPSGRDEYANSHLQSCWVGWQARAALAAVPASEPVDMILHCPKCGLQHIDAPDERTTDWANPVHRSHLCHGCGHIWRPADVPTNGVAVIATKGSADSPAAAPAPVSGMPGEPTMEMAKAFRDADVNHDHFIPAYRAMMGALPAAPAPTEQAGELPPLPEPFTDWRINRQSAFNADQMREYARAALAARQAPTVKASQ